MKLTSNSSNKQQIFRYVFWSLFSLGLIAGAAILTAWREMNAHLNSSGFQASLEETLSNKWEGRFVLGGIRSRIGLRPWVEITDASFRANNGDYRWSAQSMGIHVRVLPLIRRRLVFYRGHVKEPHVWIRRRPDGKAPEFALLERSGEENAGFSLRIDDVVVSEARLTLVDESRPGHPSVALQAEASISRTGGDTTLDLRGNIDRQGGRGRYHLFGRFGAENDVRVDAAGFPVGLIAEFVPAFGVWTGDLLFVARWKGKGSAWVWSSKCEATRLGVRGSEDIFPVTVAWELSSSSSSSLRGVWVSSGTAVRMIASLPNLHQPQGTVRLRGEKLDIKEVADWVNKIPRPAQRNDGPASPWALTVTVDLDRLFWTHWSTERLRAELALSDGMARLARFGTNVFRVTATLQWRAQRSRPQQAPW